MATLSEKILQYIEENGEMTTLKLANVFEEDHQKIIGALKSIQAGGDLLIAVALSDKTLDLTEEGNSFVENGSHEAVIYNAIPDDGIDQKQLMGLPNGKIGFSKAMSCGWISVDKSSGRPIARKRVPAIADAVRAHLVQISRRNYSEITDSLKQEYKKRKLVQETVVKYYSLRKGPGFSTAPARLETDLTAEMLSAGGWRTLKFKEYNLDALGAPPDAGHLHPLLKVRAEFRQIFLEMGFAEMPTDRFVESSFWNFDALFQPQQHPARDAHDTFFVSDPKVSAKFPMDYLRRVKEVHSKGGYGSLGYRYDWELSEAQKNLLRTHTTAVSARMLYELGRRAEFRPAKFFSVDRVFRNETLDATHLAEFHQVEGVIADRGLTLGDLIGTFAEFFRRLGIADLQFKPAYNPYTEPSMEIFCLHRGLGRWIEIGNSGIFRPEMLLPMGLPADVRVLAWGLSLERPTMIKYGYNNIRDLVGPRVDLQMVQSSPLCRLDK